MDTEKMAGDLFAPAAKANAAEEIPAGITLAEALQMRSDVQKRIAQLKARLMDNSKVQEGEKPAEDPLTLVALLKSDIALYDELIRRINRTNAQTVDGECTLTDLLARRDSLGLYTSVMREFLQAASQRVDRFTRTEIKIESTVDVPSLQKGVDAASRELRQLDARIQRLNWNTLLK